MERSRMYKNRGKDSDELRRRRVDQSNELRKAKKDQQLQKRRNIVLSELEEIAPLKEKQIDPPEHVNYDDIILKMTHPEQSVRYESIQVCRKTLSREKNPPIDEFYQRGAIKILVDALSSSSEAIVFESAWALTNIASGDSKHTKGVVDAAAVPKLISLLDGKNISIAEQSVWALGNIAGDGSAYRDLLIRSNVVPHVIRLLDRTWSAPTVVSNIAWMLSNLCRNRDPSPPKETVLMLLPILYKLLTYEGNQDVVSDTAWAISYASDAANDFIDDILASGCVKPLLKLLSSNSSTLIPPALRAIGNLVIGNDDQTQSVLSYGLLDYIPALLSNEKSSVIKESCWMISNIAAGNVSQIQGLIDHNILPMVLDLMHKAEFRVQKEACWVISNAINGGSPDQCAYLLNQGVLSALSNLLSVNDTKIVIMVLESLNKLFTISNNFDQLEQCCLALETCGGLDKLEQLQDHSNEQVYNLAYRFIEKFFNDNDNAAENKDEAESAAQEFNFSNQQDPTSKNEEFHF